MEGKFSTMGTESGGKKEGFKGTVEQIARNKTCRRERTGGKQERNERGGEEVLSDHSKKIQPNTLAVTPEQT